MTESIVVVRLTRNLRYKLTYVKIFEIYLESEHAPECAEHLRALIQAQQSAIGPLSRYLRHLDAQTQDLELDEKLMNHALTRESTKSRMRFIFDGLKRAVSWYRTQLMDRQMTAEPELKDLLIELGEIDAAKLWRTEAIMARLRIPTTLKERDWSNQQRVQPQEDADWQPRLVEDLGRPSWQGGPSGQWPRPSKYRREDSR